MYNIVCNTNTTTNANEIKALTCIESENKILKNPVQTLKFSDFVKLNKTIQRFSLCQLFII